MSAVNQGLEGIVVAETQISSVDGLKGQLVYRDLNIEEVVESATFEDCTFLLCYGHLPTEQESVQFKKALAARRALPRHVIQVIEALPKDFNQMAALRTALSALSIKGSEWPPTLDQGLDLIAKVPTLIASFYLHSKGQKGREPDPQLGHTENYLYMLFGNKPDPILAKALDAYLMIGADHGMNASTFTARVITSTRSDLISAVTGAIGALKGPLHGGAPSEVDDMLNEIKTVSNIEPWIRSQLEKGERIMGFGHRVYKTYDPRAAILKKIVKDLPHSDNEQLTLSLEVEKITIKLLEEYKPGRNLYPNVEFWAAALLRTVALPRELYSPTFAAARMAGWVANILEQAENNRLIRPTARYIGTIPPMAKQ